jgi:short chain dehydrogenase
MGRRASSAHRKRKEMDHRSGRAIMLRWHMPSDSSNRYWSSRLSGSGMPTASRMLRATRRAGVRFPPRRLKLPTEEWDRIFDIHLHAPFLVTRETAKLMIARGVKGSFVNISSGAARQMRNGSVPYRASKTKIHKRAGSHPKPPFHWRAANGRDGGNDPLTLVGGKRPAPENGGGPQRKAKTHGQQTSNNGRNTGQFEADHQSSR